MAMATRMIAAPRLFRRLRLPMRSERPAAVAADIDAIPGVGAIRLLVRGLHDERGASLDVALAADLIAHDVRIRGHDDPLLAFLVLDHEARLRAGGRGRTDS